jgi:uncharacterized membrane protein
VAPAAAVVLAAEAFAFARQLLSGGCLNRSWLGTSLCVELVAAGALMVLAGVLLRLVSSKTMSEFKNRGGSKQHYRKIWTAVVVNACAAVAQLVLDMYLSYVSRHCVTARVCQPVATNSLN